MSQFSPLFPQSHRVYRRPETGVEHVQPQAILRRILAFTGRTIDDVVNSPLARREVLGYYKLSRWMDRAGEVAALERQWNLPPLTVR